MGGLYREGWFGPRLVDGGDGTAEQVLLSGATLVARGFGAVLEAALDAPDLPDLDVLSTEVEGHVLDSYRPLLEHLGVTPAHELLGLRSGSEVIVAGVRVATQTPPMRSGKRTVFISLDDGTGVIDTAFFDEAQERAATGLFTARVMIIHGRTRRTGERGISVQADEAHDLKRFWNDWRQIVET